MNQAPQNCVRVGTFDIPYSYVRQRATLRLRPLTCTCGITLLQRGQLSMHKRSVMHRQAQRIKALLRKDCITHTEIAGRVGLTRERVRQIANQFGCDVGRVRQKACAIQTSFSQPLPSKVETVRKLAAEYGLTCEPKRMLDHRQSWRWQWSTWQVTIAGRACRIYQMWQNATRPDMLRLFRPQTRRMPEFGLYLWQDGVFVIPCKRLKTIKRQTMFVFGRERQKSGIRSAQHDWPQFWNAWELIKPKRVLSKL